MIEDNEFEIFDVFIFYVKFVDGLVFCNNIIKLNMEYKLFYFNWNCFWLERVMNVMIVE